MLSALLSKSLYLSEDAAAQFSAGYLYGITSEDKRDYIVGCFKNDAELNNTIDRAIADQASGDQAASDKEWKSAKSLYETAMANCTEVAAAFEQLKKYEEDVMARPDAEDFIEANMKKYADQITQSGENEVEEWQKGAYFNSGMFSGYTMQYLGLAPPRGWSLTSSERDSMAPAEFIAGWLFGVVGDDKQDYVKGCYTVNDDLTNTVYDGMEAFIAGDRKTGDEKLEAAAGLFVTALADCQDFNVKYREVTEEAKARMERPDW